MRQTFLSKRHTIIMCVFSMLLLLVSTPLWADKVEQIELKAQSGGTEDSRIHATKIEVSIDNKQLLLDFTCNMGTTQIEVVNANGTAIYSGQHQVSAGQSLTIDLSQASAGAYTLRINDADGSNMHGDFNIINENTN